MSHRFQLLEPREGGLLTYCTCGRWWVHLNFAEKDTMSVRIGSAAKAWLEHWMTEFQPGRDTTAGGDDANS